MAGLTIAHLGSVAFALAYLVSLGNTSSIPCGEGKYEGCTDHYQFFSKANFQGMRLDVFLAPNASVLCVDLPHPYDGNKDKYSRQHLVTSAIVPRCVTFYEMEQCGTRGGFNKLTLVAKPGDPCLLDLNAAPCIAPNQPKGKTLGNSMRAFGSCIHPANLGQFP